MSHTPLEAFGENVAAWRKALGWSQKRLAEAMTQAGVPTTRDSVANLETADRSRVTIDEWLAAARALNVTPPDLLLPPDESTAKLLPELADVPAEDARRWLAGEAPLPDVEDSDAFYRHAPQRVRNTVRTRDDPLIRALNRLTGAIRSTLLARNGSGLPAGWAKMLRAETGTVTQHVDLLCKDLEAAEAIGDVLDLNTLAAPETKG